MVVLMAPARERAAVEPQVEVLLEALEVLSKAVEALEVPLEELGAELGAEKPAVQLALPAGKVGQMATS